MSLDPQKELKPIVLVGVGEFHYRLLNQICELNQNQRPIVFVSEKKRFTPRRYLAALLQGFIHSNQVELDFWSLCQRWGVYYLQDECINISREESTLYLKKYGKLDYHSVSVETLTVPRHDHFVSQGPSVIDFQNTLQIMKELNHFFLEVGKHCPLDTRVIIDGLTQETMDLAMVIQSQLKKHCQTTEVILLESSGSHGIKSTEQKFLKQNNIRILSGTAISEVRDHCLELSDGLSFEFDIFIPMSGWRSTDLIGKIVQKENVKIMVEKDLSLQDDAPIYFYGDNVFFEHHNQPVTHLYDDETLKTVLSNLVLEKGDKKRNEVSLKFKKWNERAYLQRSFTDLLTKKDETSLFFEKWQNDFMAELSKVKPACNLEFRRREIKKELHYQSEHMSRPWRGSLNESHLTGLTRLISFSGFNHWGSVTQSTEKIFECLILKSLTKGVCPKRFRFMLTLPRSQGKLTQSFFQNTIKALEEISRAYDIELDGGDTFDGHQWRLSLTLSGEKSINISEKYKNHDYILITRPLGYGLVWSNRTHDQFSSKWFEESINTQEPLQFSKFSDFISTHQPSSINMIEEWGFLQHASLSLTPDQQLMINFREIPRHKGVDLLLPSEMNYPALDINWARSKDDVAFDRSEVSTVNSILWDPLSQGSLVIGLSAKNYQQALMDLKNMGFQKTKLIGCVRPKVNNNKVVLSDWMPQL